MRTVLVVDEMLGHQVSKALRAREGGCDVVRLDHMELRDLGYQGALKRVRELVISKRSVLVLGGKAWDSRASVTPTKFLHDLRLQRFVPSILLLAEGQTAPAVSWRPFIHSIVPTDGGAGLVTTIADCCHAAWAWAHSPLKPVVTHFVSRDRARGRRPSLARVLPLARSGE